MVGYYYKFYLIYYAAAILLLLFLVLVLLELTVAKVYYYLTSFTSYTPAAFLTPKALELGIVVFLVYAYNYLLAATLFA